MFQGASLSNLIELLEKRGAYLYHACQLLDYRSYLEVGGIPSRAYLENKGQAFTPFETDNSDHDYGVWDKVFANLSDFGSTFARGCNAVPNTYGPVLFQISPKALSQATDVAICLWSAGKQNFNRKTDSLSTIDDVNRLFKYSVGEQRSQYPKYKEELKKEFNELSSDKISAPEISCTVNLGYLSLDYVNYVRVEPYIIQGKSLQSWVEKFRDISNFSYKIYQREQSPSYTSELIKLLDQGMPSLADLKSNSELSPELKNWADQLINNNLEYQFNRFAKYFRTGTLCPILKQSI